MTSPARNPASLSSILQNNQLEAHYQPIVAMDEGRIAGYEALIRGPVESGLREPKALLEAAANSRILRDFERHCWRTIVEDVSSRLEMIPRWARIFLNILPEDILDADFLAHVLEVGSRNRLDPARVVIEITETTRIDDYDAFNAALAHFRDRGFGVAVDDAGAGHAGLQMITEINPDYLKIDQGLVRGINSSLAKRAGVQALLLLARSLGMTVIAEGIETEEELQVVQQLGISLGQGYLLAHPTPDLVVGVRHIPSHPQQSPLSALDLNVLSASGRIGDVATPAPTVTGSTSIRMLMQIFDKRRSSDSVVVIEAGEPSGLIMRHQLQSELSRPFATSWVDKATVAQILNERPLVLDWESPLDVAAGVATSRTSSSRYDDLVVTRNGKLVGTVSLHDLLNAITTERGHSVRYANPLTGLPGTPVIERWVRDHVTRREEITLMRFDISGLRIFNEIYGFHQGDRVIRIAAETLQTELAQSLGGLAKLAHLSADDFLAVVPSGSEDELTSRVQNVFQEKVLQLYHPEDRARGHILRTSRTAAPERIPIMALRVATVRTAPGIHRHFAELLDRLSPARTQIDQPLLRTHVPAQARRTSNSHLRVISSP